MPFDWKRFKTTSPGEMTQWKPTAVGDKVEGEIITITSTTFGGKAEETPELHVLDSAGVIHQVTASWVVLCSRLAELGPDVGDTISIIHTGMGDAKGAKSAPRLFDVIVKRGETSPPPAADATAPGPAQEPF